MAGVSFQVGDGEAFGSVRFQRIGIHNCLLTFGIVKATCDMRNLYRIYASHRMYLSNPKWSFIRQKLYCNLFRQSWKAFHRNIAQKLDRANCASKSASSAAVSIRRGAKHAPQSIPCRRNIALTAGTTG